MNPDCKKGSHTACSGTGWDERTDSLTHCPCQCHAEVQP